MREGEVLYRPPAEGRHDCQPPMRCAVYGPSSGGDDWAPRFKGWQPCEGSHDGYGCINGEAAEPIGTIWRCDATLSESPLRTCHRQWIVFMPQNHPASRLQVEYRPQWRPATWLERYSARRAVRRAHAAHTLR